MFEVEVVNAFHTAIERKENWKPTGPRWTFIDADMYMAVMPINASTKRVDTFYRMFNDLADSFSQSYPEDMTYEEYMSKKASVEAEYRELFGITA